MRFETCLLFIVPIRPFALLQNGFLKVREKRSNNNALIIKPNYVQLID